MPTNRSTTRRLTFTLLAALAVLALVVAGCGSKSDSGSDSAAATDTATLSPEDAAVKTVEDSLITQADGDGKAACALFTAKYIKDIYDGDDCVKRVEESAEGAGAGVVRDSISASSPKIDGDKATVVANFEFTDDATDKTVKMKTVFHLVKQGDAWKVDSFEDPEAAEIKD